jgi:Tfp pilus assembly protein FimT
MTSIQFATRRAAPRNRRRSLGQGMTEYLIVLGLIAIAGIAVFSFFGTSMRNQVAGMAAEIAGDTGATAVAAAATAAKSAETKAGVNYNMKTYVEGGNTGAGGK